MFSDVTRCRSFPWDVAKNQDKHLQPSAQMSEGSTSTNIQRETENDLRNIKY